MLGSPVRAQRSLLSLTLAHLGNDEDTIRHLFERLIYSKKGNDSNESIYSTNP